MQEVVIPLVHQKHTINLQKEKREVPGIFEYHTKRKNQSKNLKEILH